MPSKSAVLRVTAHETMFQGRGRDHRVALGSRSLDVRDDA